MKIAIPTSQLGTYGSNRSSLNALRSNKWITELGMLSGGDDRGFQVHHYYCYPSANRQALKPRRQLQADLDPGLTNNEFEDIGMCQILDPLEKPIILLLPSKKFMQIRARDYL